MALLLTWYSILTSLMLKNKDYCKCGGFMVAHHAPLWLCLYEGPLTDVLNQSCKTGGVAKACGNGRRNLLGVEHILFVPSWCRCGECHGVHNDGGSPEICFFYLQFVGTGMSFCVPSRA